MCDAEDVIFTTITTLTDDGWSAVCLTRHWEGIEWGCDRYGARDDGFDHLENHPDHHVGLDQGTPYI
jgi:hypothetical protein